MSNKLKIIQAKARHSGYVYSPSYMGGRDEEDGSLKLAWGKRPPSQPVSWKW
jgi:hypothetical protein